MNTTTYVSLRKWCNSETFKKSRSHMFRIQTTVVDTVTDIFITWKQTLRSATPHLAATKGEGSIAFKLH